MVQQHSPDEVWTIEKLLSWTQKFFKDKGIESARLDAELLLAHVLGQKRVYLYTHYDKPVDTVERDKFRDFVKRRAAREPVSQILQVKEFYGREFRITGDVLTPRPETEHVVDAVLRWARPKKTPVITEPDSEHEQAHESSAIRGFGQEEPGATGHEEDAGGSETYIEYDTPTLYPAQGDGLEVQPDASSPDIADEHHDAAKQAGLATGAQASSEVQSKTDIKKLRILDLGTGSGCIAITLALELPHAQVVAVDRSAHALEVARQNAMRWQAAERITFVESNWFEALSVDGGGFDMIVSNPPYLAEQERGMLAPEVKEYEPEMALFAEHEGLADIETILNGCRGFLNTPGLVAIEIGYKQADRVKVAMEHTGLFANVHFEKDLQGHYRVALGEVTTDKENAAAS